MRNSRVRMSESPLPEAASKSAQDAFVGSLSNAVRLGQGLLCWAQLTGQAVVVSCQPGILLCQMATVRDSLRDTLRLRDR